MSTKTAIFQENRKPMAARSGSFVITRGSPAIRVPLGQMYWQNQGLPWPRKSVAARGRKITKTPRITYFSQTRIR